MRSWILGACVLRHGVGAFGLAFTVIFLTAPPAGAEIILTDPSHPLYHRVAAAAGSDLRIEKSSEVTGNLHSNGTVQIKKDVIADGDVTAVGTVQNQGTVSGTITESADPVVLPPIPAADELRALADRIIETDVTFTDEILDDVVFVAGEVRIVGSLQGEGTILATGDVRLREDPTPPSEETRVSIITLGNVRLDKHRSFRGALRAGGNVDLEMGVDFEGVVIADGVVHVKKDSTVTFLDLTDTQPPALEVLLPSSMPVTIEDPSYTLIVVYGDADSGVDLASLAVAFSGQDVTASCTTGFDVARCPTPALATGQYDVTASVRDVAGNLAEVSGVLDVVVDLEPPALTLLAPEVGALGRSASIPVNGSVSDDGELAAVTVNGQAVTSSDGTFSTQVDLEEGPNLVEVRAHDATGKESLVWAVAILDTRPPLLAIDSPRPGALTNQGSARLAGRANDANGIDRIEVAGVQVASEAGRFSLDLPLQDGPNSFLVRAFDRAGNSATAEVAVTRFALPEVRITRPVDLSWIAATTVDVVGTVGPGVVEVSVNGIPATTSDSGFVATGVPLLEGGNVLTASAVDARGHVATDSVHVVRDLTAPRLEIYGPTPDAVVTQPTVAVFGLVNDIVPGTVNASEASVLVNGQAAQVANRGFLLPALPLAEGPNEIVVTATDQSGNRGEARVSVRRQAAGGRRVEIVSGDRQSAVIGSDLAQPLVVRVVDATGLPAPDVPVLFKVQGNNGTLDGGRRQIAVATDAQGEAAARLTLGTRVGVASQRVEAVAVGYGRVTFLEEARSGEPALIVVDSGDQQVGVAGRELPRPFVAVVTDAGRNRLAQVPVRFTVRLGRGQFSNGQQEIVVATDSDGRAIVPFRLDPEEGTAANVVEANVVALPEGPFAAFTATGWAAGDPARTAIRGVVLDNSNVPVPGVTMRIKNTAITAQTDAEGYFRIHPAPVGTFYLIADGSTTTRPGSWPDLEFVVTTIPGRENDLGMPIYLLPLDLGNGIFVDESRGGTITLPEVPGFALEIVPGSVTFPGGSHSGMVSVTTVHSDKMPMVPNFGQQPRFIVTIQPPGARFEPPARLTLPNVSGRASGEVIEFYSFDHDLGHFVSIGPATVSDDGATITSNPGVGILKAGWHCGDTPGFTGSTHDCPICYSCVRNWCTPDDDQPCTRDEPCTTNPHCSGGICEVDPVEVYDVDGPCFGELAMPVTFTADSNAPSKVKWQTDGGQPATGTGGSFTTTFASEGAKFVGAGCPDPTHYETIQVYPGCGDVSTDVRWQHVPTFPACFGATGPLQHSFRHKVCADSDRLCLRLEYLQIDYQRAVPPNCAVDVPSAYAPVVTEETCEQIIADLTPGPENSDTGPPRTIYWVRSITEAHEALHETQLRDLVDEQFVQRVLDLLKEDRWCVDGCSTSPDASQVKAEVLQIWNEHVRATWEDEEEKRLREIAAYDEDRIGYLARIAEIQARAQSEGWITCQGAPPPGENP